MGVENKPECPVNYINQLYFMTQTHKLFVCGHTSDGKIIINNQNEIQDTPTPVDIPFQIKQICAGVAHLWGLGLGF